MARLALLVTAILVLVSVPAQAVDSRATSPYPHPDTFNIDVPVSIGGVSVFDKLGDARDTWRGKGRCNFGPDFSRCVWGSLTSRKGFASISANGGPDHFVDRIQIAAGFVSSKKAIVSGSNELTDFITPRGIGLFAEIKEVLAKVPGAEEASFGATVPGRGNSSMRFSTDGTPGNRRVSIISITSGISPGTDRLGSRRR